jgi:translation initiation factor 4E
MTDTTKDTMFHKLSDTWTLWAHLPHDTNWSASSYKKIYEFNTAEQAIALIEMLPPKLVMNCMLFLMRTGIVPMWEDAQNRNGGCFSYKVANKEVNQAWKQLSYVTVGETISTNLNVIPHVNGITISPKKNFCIIKIWMANCNFQNAGVVRELEGITAHGCLFKKHTPEY